ncbi:MAG TPA: DUF3798 domain-containing protein, partial [Patescibacteria group bacterium]|nr:DUF3798 domain-containing protein [Patescibacteria group bacterium]
EEYRAAARMAEKYGPDVILLKTYPENFREEPESIIANIMAFAADPDIKAIVMVRAVSGTAAAFERLREKRPDILLIAGGIDETPDWIGPKADVLFDSDEAAIGRNIPRQAKKMGAVTFVSYFFPRPMSDPLLVQRRDIMKAECEKLGVRFIDTAIPELPGSPGVFGVQPFLAEDVPLKVKAFGKNTCFFSAEYAVQETLIKATLENGAINTQAPGLFPGYPGALGIDIPPDKADDMHFLAEQIKTKIAKKNGTGRFSACPAVMPALFVEAGVEYAKAWANGQFKEKNNKEEVIKRLADAAGVKMNVTLYKGTSKTGQEQLGHFYLVTADYVTF